MTKPCVVCKKTPTDRAHIRSRGAGGSWDDWNIMALCRAHHRAQHDFGWFKFAMKFPAVMWELERKGWYFETVLGRRRLGRKK